MEKRSLLSAISGSFYDSDLYQNVYSHWGAGRMLVYILLLLTLITIPFAVKTQISWNRFMKNTASALLEDFPEIHIQNGQISCTGELPFLLALDSTTTFIVDTTGLYSATEGEPGQILLTNGWISMVKKSGEVRQYELANVENFTISEEKIKEWGRLIGFLIIPLTLLSFVCFPGIGQFIRGFFFALIGMLVASLNDKLGEFGGLYKVALIAGTPTILISRLLSLMGVAFPGLGFVLFGVSCFYIWFGVTSLKNKPFLPPQNNH